MWIKMLKTYAGPLGVFPAGQKFDLPESTVQQLKKKKATFGATCAPWDEKVDHKAVKHNAFMAKVNKAIDTADNLKEECRDIAIGIEKLQDSLEQKVKELNNAANKAKKLAKSAGIKWPSENTTEDADNA